MRSDPLALDDVISVSRARTVVTTDAAILTRAQQQFAQTRALVIRGFLAPGLLTWVQAHVASAAFHTSVHPMSGVEDGMNDNEAVWLLWFLLNTAEIRSAVEHLTGVTPLRSTVLRIYRFVPGTDHRHDWHDDVMLGRRLGISVNLSVDEFSGGHLQLREKTTGHPLADVGNTGAGDAVIFLIDPGVEHQVLPVVGTVPRVALAGWFCDTPA